MILPFRFLSFLLGVFALSICLTVSAVEDCRVLVGGQAHQAVDPQAFINESILGFKPQLKMQEPKLSGKQILRTIMAFGPDGQVLGKIDFRVEDSEQKLVISYVVRVDRARGAGLPKAMLAQILNQHPNIKTVVAEFMDINALVVDQQRRSGLSLEEAILKAPTAKAAVELGFTNIDKVKDYSFCTEGAYHLTLSRP